MEVSKFVLKVFRRIVNLIKGKKTAYRVKKIQQELDLVSHQYGLNCSKRDKIILVSLTSHPARFSSVCYSIKSMMVQTMKPDRIVLYLDDTCSMSDLPAQLVDLQQYGLEIEFRPVNMKPHKKYYYAIKENPDAHVITVDDDIIYPQKLVEELMTTSERFPGCVVASRAHKILFDELGRIQSYNDWTWECGDEYLPSMALCATGVGGVLYPPYSMEESVFNKELFLRLTPNADDLWLKFIQVKSGTKVVICSQDIRKNRLPMPENVREALNSSNVHKNYNDKYLKNLMEYFKYTKKDFGYN